jgi:exopolysaccharide production protein ExoQ
MNQLLRLAEKCFIVLGIAFFSGVFGIHSLGILFPKALVTLIRFFIWGGSTFLVCIFWKNTIRIVSRNISICILSALAFLSFIWSELPEFTWFNSRDIWMMTFFALYFATRFSLKEQIEIIAYTSLIGSILSIIFVIGLPGIGKEVDSAHLGAWKGLYGHKNLFGSMMVLKSLTFFTLPNNNSKIYKWGGFSLAILLIILSTSKTSLVITSLLILIILFYKNFRWRGKISVIFIDIGILILGCVALLVFSYWVEILTGLGRDPTLTGRTPLWSLMIARLIEKPLLGYGRGAFFAPKSRYGIEAGQIVGTGWIPPHGHNGLLDLSIDLGLIGLSFFLITYFTNFARALKLAYAAKDVENIWPLAYLIFLLMNNITESLLLYQTNIFWVLFITLVFTLSQKPQTKQNNNQTKQNYPYAT